MGASTAVLLASCFSLEGTLTLERALLTILQ